MHRRIVLRRGWVSQPFVRTSVVNFPKPTFGRQDMNLDLQLLEGCASLLSKSGFSGFLIPVYREFKDFQVESSEIPIHRG